MGKHRYRVWIAWGIVLVWAGLIFYFSAKQGKDSAQMSGMILEFLQKLFGETVTSFMVRKGAHIFVFFILCLLIGHASWRTFGRIRLGMSLVTALVYACFDEIHQAFVPGRACRIQDVLIDGIGILLALIILFLVSRIQKKKQKAGGLE